MKVTVTVKNGDAKLQALREAEMHIKKAKEIFLWALSGPMEIEMLEPPKDDGSDKINEIGSEIARRIAEHLR